MKQFMLLAFAFLLGACSAFSQSTSLIVRDENSLQPVQKAYFQLKFSDQTSSGWTDAQGLIPLNRESFPDSLYIRASGYKSLALSAADLEDSKGILLLSEVSYDLDAVVLSASRFEEKALDIPSQIKTLTAKDIAFANQATTADLLQQSGQVFVQKSQMGGGSPVIRGFEASRVLLVVDGVRLNNAIYRGGHLQNIITVDQNMLDRTEILFGPGSTIYGSDALGGVIHLYSKQPSLNPSPSQKGLAVSGNSFVRYATASQEKTGHLDFNLGTQKWAFLTSISASQFGDLMTGAQRNPFYGDFGKTLQYVERINGVDSVILNPNPNRQVGTGYSQLDLMEKILFQQNSYISHLLTVQYSTSSDVPRYDRLQQYSGGNLRYAEWNYGPQKRLLASYRLNLGGPTALYDQGRVILTYQDIEESRITRRRNNLNRQSQVEHVQVLTATAEFEKKLGEQELRYGLDGAFNQVNSSAFSTDITTNLESPIATRYPGAGSSYRTLAAFASHSWEISPKFILSDGLRLSNVVLNADFADTTFFPFPYTSLTQNNTALNGNVGLVFLPGKTWRFSLMGSTGFRAPNVDDIGKVFESTPGNLVVPNPELGPEYVWNGEISVAKMLSPGVHVEGTGWYSYFQHAITAAPGTLDGQDSVWYDGQWSAVTSLVNSEQGAYIYGGSLGFTADITEKVSLHSNLTYTYGRMVTDTTPYPLDHIPPLFGRTGIQWKVKKFRGEFFALYNGWKHISDFNLNGEDNAAQATANGSPAWMTLNLRASYVVNPRLTLQSSLENILDSYYRPFASGMSGAGRSLSLSIRASF